MKDLYRCLKKERSVLSVLCVFILCFSSTIFTKVPRLEKDIKERLTIKGLKVITCSQDYFGIGVVTWNR